MKRKGGLLNVCKNGKKHKSNDNLYKFINLAFADKQSAIKENISLPDNFDKLNQLEQMKVFKNIISQFHGWDIYDEIEFYNKDYEYSSTGALIIAGGLGVQKNLSIGDNAIISGNLTVNGNTVSVNSITVNISDNIIVLNSGPSGTLNGEILDW